MLQMLSRTQGKCSWLCPSCAVQVHDELCAGDRKINGRRAALIIDGLRSDSRKDFGPCFTHVIILNADFHLFKEQSFVF